VKSRFVAGLADLRRDTPCPAGTPTGAGATASPRLRRGFGHLLAVDRQPKPRALTGRGGWLASGLLAFGKTVQQWRAGVKGQPGGRSPERSGGTGRGLGAKPEPLTPDRNDHALGRGQGWGFHPCPLTTEGARRGLGQRPKVLLLTP
jgi:hypothetical protein